MQLSKETAAQLRAGTIDIPAQELFSLPEKVLQFGTGVLLRGLPDHFIDKANKQNIFNGRIVVVKSTSTGGTDAFAKQDGLYTLLERGMIDGVQTENTYINTSISRVLSASEDWNKVLECASNPALQVIISNTTEVGIVLVEPDALTDRPVSFPGRLLHFLFERYKIFHGTDESGMVIVPTELIVDNGTRLKNIVVTLAQLGSFPSEFIYWLDTANDFCNSLVDCIVPGKLSSAEHTAVEKKLGYEDELMIMSEPYRLWAIETRSERTKNILSFSRCDEGVVLAPDINKFRELKLRLLNATHTLSCGLAHLSGFITVKEAMQNADFINFITHVMMDEIIPLITNDEISFEEAHQFAQQVIDRFQNPYIEHLWIAITAQYSSKMAMRTVPLIEKQYMQSNEAPVLMALGFAAFILFMRSKTEDGNFYGECNGTVYRINDDKAILLYHKWQSNTIETIVEDTLRDKNIFGSDLTRYPGFAASVNRSLQALMQKGAGITVHSIFAKKTMA